MITRAQQSRNLILGLAILNMADAIVTTLTVLPGYAIELNPLMLKILEFSPSLFLIVKAAASFLLFRAYMKISDITAQKAYVVVLTVSLLYFIIVVMGICSLFL